METVAQSIDPSALQLALVAALNQAHAQAALRGNISSTTVANAAAGSGSYTASIAAALLTLGGLHGPLQQTQELLERDDPAAAALAMLDRGRKVPGWGNSFIKGEEDPVWAPVRAALKEHWPAVLEDIDAVTTALHGRGKPVYPNPSAYTAACSIVVGLPPCACAYLFVNARLGTWTRIFLGSVKEF